MKKVLVVAFVIAIMAGYTSIAGAVTVTFDFVGSVNYQYKNNDDPFVFTVDGVTATATGYYDSLSNPAYSVAQGLSGLGLQSISSDDVRIDGWYGGDDILCLAFSQEVNLSSILFGFTAEGDDDFQLYVGAFDTSAEINSPIPASGAFDVASYDFWSNIYYFQATGDGDDYTVKSLTINTAPVPEPSTILLMGLGLAGLIGIRARGKIVK